MNTISVGVRGTDHQFLQSFQRNSDRVRTSVERLTTGKRINRPSDDPPGFVAAEGFRRDLTDLKAKLKAIASDRRESRLQQSGLASIQSALTDLRGRVVSAADGFFFTADQRSALEAEIDEAVKAIDRIAKLTGNETAAGFTAVVAVTMQQGEAVAAEMVDAASQGVVRQRAALAAEERAQLDTFEQLYQDQIVITSEALSQIEDTDFAAETANLVEGQILSQGAMAALGYANRLRADQIAQLLDETA